MALNGASLGLRHKSPEDRSLNKRSIFFAGTLSNPSTGEAQSCIIDVVSRQAAGSRREAGRRLVALPTGRVREATHWL
jgi:hypothetical protein